MITSVNKPLPPLQGQEGPDPQALQQLQNGSSGSTNAEIDISCTGKILRRIKAWPRNDRKRDDEMEEEDRFNADGEASEFKQKGFGSV
ncbi:hypothetical protein NC652_033269 [Populus alba x Populus x berolinensis]|nr:hypothetical protein NC652_033269 [Populus alba x Populus x berolinensis]